MKHTHRQRIRSNRHENQTDPRLDPVRTGRQHLRCRRFDRTQSADFISGASAAIDTGRSAHYAADGFDKTGTANAIAADGFEKPVLPLPSANAVLDAKARPRPGLVVPGLQISRLAQNLWKRACSRKPQVSRHQFDVTTLSRARVMPWKGIFVIDWKSVLRASTIGLSPMPLRNTAHAR